MAKDSKKDSNKYFLTLTLAALGVVYGDIGTSPLYAVRECFREIGGMEVNTANVMGVISLIFWSLILVISIKYLIFIVRADNEGEGGILALMESVESLFKRRKKAAILLLGLFGAALLYGDGMITPAISVLSAIEGLKVATPIFKPYIIPITVVILFGLFYFQKQGTSGVGKIFGPTMIVWFVCLGVLGIYGIIQSPEILAALNPYHAIQFFIIHSWRGILVLGAVFLVVTGGEALYADMGHFSKKTIRTGWFGLVLPCLTLNYFGQGALLLNDPSAVDNPFYKLPPHWALYPMVALSTIATIIASQAIISGVFSLTYQAVNLGYFPRVNIVHTSKEERGQVYLPSINWILFLSTTALVFGFKTSSNLAGAYGVAVSTTMVITSLLAFAAMVKLWKWNLLYAISLTIGFLIIDLAFFSANLFKIKDGGWFPIVIAGLVYLLMTTWAKGREILARRIRHNAKPLRETIEHMDLTTEDTISGTAIYLTQQPETVPTPLTVNYRYNKILHERVIIMCIDREKIPYMPFEKVLEIEKINERFYKVVAHYGFKDNVSFNRLIPMLADKIDGFDPEELTFVLGTKDLLPHDTHEMATWRKNIFVFLQKNDTNAMKFYNLPHKNVLEIGSQYKF